MKNKNLWFIAAFTFTALQLHAESVIAKADSSRLTSSGYVDAYYRNLTDFPAVNALQLFTTVSALDRHFGLNLVQIGDYYISDKIPGNITIHYGVITQATGSGTLNQGQEANSGYRVAKVVWFDAGLKMRISVLK